MFSGLVDWLRARLLGWAPSISAVETSHATDQIPVRNSARPLESFDDETTCALPKRRKASNYVSVH